MRSSLKSSLNMILVFFSFLNNFFDSTVHIKNYLYKNNLTLKHNKKYGKGNFKIIQIMKVSLHIIFIFN